jgi:uncharacterized protein VirK/YbjX
LLSRLTAQFVSDWSHYSPKAAAARLWRVRRVLPMSEVRRRLDANPACQRHMALVAPNDPVFFLSHRHYLVQGLSAEQRAAAALCHYEHEAGAFDADYLDAMYTKTGLVLWRHEFEGHAFDLRLMPGNDVLYEGGASLVLHQDGGRVAVLSYATVPSASFLHEPGAPDRVLFIARKQTGENHDYQKVFNKAFDRCTPWHLCVGALTGLALAQGLDRAVGIVAAVHPSRTPELEARLKVAYDDFWTSLGGRPASPFGLVFDLPMHLTPLDELDAKARKRAVARREHIQQVQDATQALIARHLRAPAQ